MADIIAVYNESRINNSDNPKGVLGQVLEQERWPHTDLEYLATHLANCVANDIYPSRKSIYPMIDLESMMQLKLDKGIIKPKAALQAVYHLLDDYLLPEKQQRYKFTPYQAATIIQAAIDLGLAKDFDVVYVERVIQQAEKGCYRSIEEGHRVISMLMDMKHRINRTKTPKE